MTGGSAWLQLDDASWIATPMNMRIEWLAPGVRVAIQRGVQDAEVIHIDEHSHRPAQKFQPYRCWRLMCGERSLW